MPEAQQTPRSVNTREPTPRGMAVKRLNSKNKEKISKAVRGKNKVMSDHLLSREAEARRQWVTS